MENQKPQVVSVESGVAISQRLQSILGLERPIVSEPYPLLVELSMQGLVPSVGCEIEVHWSHILRQTDPELAENFITLGYKGMTAADRRQFRRLADAHRASHTPLIESLEAAGIPQGQSKLWEFSLQPSRLYTTQADQVEALYAGGLLLPEVIEYPLHITVADVAPGKASGLMCFALEVTGGTTMRRMANEQHKKSWSIKSGNGVYYRESNHYELLEAERATEFRTMVAQSPEQVRRLLHNAQWLGTLTILQASKHLTGNVVNDLIQLANEFDLDCSRQWHSIEQPELEPMWSRLWELLDDPEQSLGKAVQSLIDAHIADCHEAMQIGSVNQ